MSGAKSKRLSPFDFLKTINDTKINLIDMDESNAKAYNGFMVNRSLSYFSDTVIISNEMNRLHHIDSKMQYDFLINIIRKRKRFSKWDKPDLRVDMECIKEYFGYSEQKAKQVIGLLTESQIQTIKHKVGKGGRE
jgi:hypothetical protein|tara:strand:- start:389 stop:793 length:405 start_codon:yes stop_codon:yes gene_type:complete